MAIFLAQQMGFLVTKMATRPDKMNFRNLWVLFFRRFCSRLNVILMKMVVIKSMMLEHERAKNKGGNLRKWDLAYCLHSHKSKPSSKKDSFCVWFGLFLIFAGKPFVARFLECFLLFATQENFVGKLCTVYKSFVGI